MLRLLIPALLAIAPCRLAAAQSPSEDFARRVKVFPKKLLRPDDVSVRFTLDKYPYLNNVRLTSHAELQATARRKPPQSATVSAGRDAVVAEDDRNVLVLTPNLCFSLVRESPQKEWMITSYHRSSSAMSANELSRALSNASPPRASSVRPRTMISNYFQTPHPTWVTGGKAHAAGTRYDYDCPRPPADSPLVKDKPTAEYASNVGHVVYDAGDLMVAARANASNWS